MSYNKYNTRNSGRFNAPGTFVTAGNLGGGPQGGYGNMGPPQPPPSMQFNKPLTHNMNFNNTQNSQTPFTPPMKVSQSPPLDMNLDKESDMTSDNLDSSNADDAPGRPHWMKSKLVGVKKISNKERRRRQNENLRRLLTPKNALMVLNEILPGEQLANQFKVQAVTNTGTQYYKPNLHSFCAELCVDGVNYKGFGENKLIARNNAAEQAIRDLMIKRMSRLFTDNNEGEGGSGAAGGAGGELGEGEDSAVPMIQLASYALHKLFTEWEWDGHKVPQLRPHSVSETGSESGSTKGKAAKEVPARAGAMHPCMLLAYLRPQLAYRELPAQGTAPQNMLFSMAVDVDGNTYVGTATKKKEARRLAAKAACEEIFKTILDTPFKISGTKNGGYTDNE